MFSFPNLSQLRFLSDNSLNPGNVLANFFDSSGIEAFVAENNPKYANRIIKQLKAYAKSRRLGKDYNPYAAAYSSMPSCASANPQIKQLYVNGHFCYVFKFGIITNGLGIIRHISFYNRDFMTAHPDISVDKKSDSPDEDKCAHDSKLLIPTLKDFFHKHPLINPKVFLGDAAFDSALLYKDLLSGNTFGENRNFSKAYIPLNHRSQLKSDDYTINGNGIPCCPKDSSLPMRSEGTATRKNGLVRYKFSCPKVKWIKDPVTGKQKRQCLCELPCTDSPIRTNGIRKRPYNILIMEEVQTIVALGAGAITKRVYPDGRIERCENVKDVALYIEKIDEMIERKRKLQTTVLEENAR